MEFGPLPSILEAHVCKVEFISRPRGLAPTRCISRRGCIAIQFQQEPINNMQTDGGVAIFWDFGKSIPQYIYIGS